MIGFVNEKHLFFLRPVHNGPLERMTGLEPATSYLEGTHSTNWATSAFLFWWTRMESNHWPSHYECAALTVWATSPKRCRWKVLINFTGSFSVTPPLRIRYVSMLLVSIHCLFRHTGIFLFLWRITDSNRWPLRCKRSALSAELIPQNNVTAVLLNCLFTTFIVVFRFLHT